MTVDAQTGQIWVGNNGQDLWETAHLLRRAENYGWSVFEGNHPFHALAPLGPTPPVPPTLEHAHSEARSLTGGVVYYGPSFPELTGVYVYGDYATGKIWGTRHDGREVVWHQELADTSLQIAGFALSHQGDLIVVDHAGGLYRLIKSPPAPHRLPFPRLLSETGLFADVAIHSPQAGVIPYRVNAPGWHDGATSEYLLAVPGESTIKFASTRAWDLPEGSVVVQTLSLPGEPDGTREESKDHTTSSKRRRVETRLLTKQRGSGTATLSLERASRRRTTRYLSRYGPRTTSVRRIVLCSHPESCRMHVVSQPRRRLSANHVRRANRIFPRKRAPQNCTVPPAWSSWEY